MHDPLPARREKPGQQVGIGVAGKQHHLEKKHRRRPHGRTAAEPGKNELAQQRLHFEQQERAGENGGGETEPGPTRALFDPGRTHDRRATAKIPRCSTLLWLRRDDRVEGKLKSDGDRSVPSVIGGRRGINARCRAGGNVRRGATRCDTWQFSCRFPADRPPAMPVLLASPASTPSIGRHRSGFPIAIDPDWAWVRMLPDCPGSERASDPVSRATGGWYFLHAEGGVR